MPSKTLCQSEYLCPICLNCQFKCFSNESQIFLSFFQFFEFVVFFLVPFEENLQSSKLSRAFHKHAKMPFPSMAIIKCIIFHIKCRPFSFVSIILRVWHICPSYKAVVGLIAKIADALTNQSICDNL